MVAVQMQHKSYIFGFLISILFATILFKFLFTNSAHCDSTIGGKDSGKFMAYCQSRFHGHYDHAAYLFDLESGLADHVRQANLLFLGSSKIQYGLSTSALTDLTLHNRSIRPYLLGFGHAEQDVFSAIILDQIKPAPTMIVINADPFFQNAASEHAKQLIAESNHEKINALIKRYWHQISEASCSGKIPLGERLICGSQFTVFRSAADGRWIFPGNDLNTYPVSELKPTSQDDILEKAYAANADKFLEKLSVSRRCVVLTFVPTGSGKPFIAHGIAERLGIKFIAPNLDGLYTFDGSHLSTESRERWSRVFLEELEPIIASCIQ